MHFAHTPHPSGRNSSKFALVVVFHVLLGIGLVKTINTRHFSLPSLPAPVNLVPAIDPPVTLPPPTALPVETLPAPRIVAPMPEVPVAPPSLPNQVTTTTTTVTEAMPPAQPGTGTMPPLQPATATGGTGVVAVRAAAMLDGCAKPAYPAQAARNGDTGTVTLALLVGVDGRVTGSRIERSSGFRELDKAALAALSRCAFKPAMQGDVAQAGWTLVAYDWRLE